MKNIFLLLTCSFQFAAAQYVPQRTKTIFNSFVEKTSVEWAAYANESMALPEFTKKLLTKYRAGGLKGFRTAEYGTREENNLKILLFKDFAGSYIPLALPIFDSLGNMLTGKTEAKKIFDIQTELPNSSIEFYKTLYVENGKLHAYISRISLKRPVITPSGDSLGVAEVASFNVNKQYNAAEKGKLTFIGQTVSTLQADSIPYYQVLKQLYGRNLIQTIWPAVISGKTKVYYGDQIVRGDSLAAGNYPGAQFIPIPTYDSLGNLMVTIHQYQEMNAASFDKISLTEKWYYDELRDIILCMIPEAVIYKKTFSAEEDAVKFRLVF